MEMPIDRMYDALCDEVTHFRNEMLRRGVKSAEPEKWINEFLHWLDEWDFECRYAETLGGTHAALVDNRTGGNRQ